MTNNINIPPKMTDNQMLAKKYKKLTDKEHVLHVPDTYTGSMESCNNLLYCFNNEENKIEEKDIHYIPGLFKLFDEAIVNCRDHAIRTKVLPNDEISNNIPLSNIEVCLEKETGTISFHNDGNGIDIAIHPEHKLWIPEMIFAHLKTGTNYIWFNG